MFFAALGCSPNPKGNDPGRKAQPYCNCWCNRSVIQDMSECTCGEIDNVSEWKWEQPQGPSSSWVEVSEDQKQVTFHPLYSSGTAAVRGDTPLLHNKHYYWEVKMLSDTYGTDIMVGIGTNKVDLGEFLFKFTSLLGQDAESYGLSFMGGVRHNARVSRDTVGFCKGSIIGVRLDMWTGTLEFCLNRKAQGVSFYNLRRHQLLFPMLCSTAAQSSMRLIYTTSWEASLLVDAAKTLAASVSRSNRRNLPPGLIRTLRRKFWLTLSDQGCILDENDDSLEVDKEKSANCMLENMTPGSYVDGLYGESMEPTYPIVVWE